MLTIRVIFVLSLLGNALAILVVIAGGSTT